MEVVGFLKMGHFSDSLAAAAALVVHKRELRCSFKKRVYGPQLRQQHRQQWDAANAQQQSRLK
jgi:hypothetical protein